MRLELAVEEQTPGTKVIRAIGEIDMHTVQNFDDVVHELLDEGILHIVMDFTRLNYISSSGLGVIMNCQAELLGNEGKLEVIGTHGNVRESLQLTGII